MKDNLNYKAEITSREIQRKFTYASTVVLSLDISYPTIKLVKSPIIQFLINQNYLRQAQNFNNYAEKTLVKNAVQEYKDSVQNGFPFRPYDAVMKYTVTLNKSCHLSTYFDKYEYTGGAHGNTIRNSDNFDLKTGRRVRMRDLFPRGTNYRRLVLEQILKQADKMMEENPILFEDYRQLIVKYFDPDSFNLTPKGISVYYQQYEIGPYASGIITFEIPYESLGIDKPMCGE